MTRDEILNMPAGRAMDALIAKKVMGLEQASKSEFWWWKNGVLDELPDYSLDVGTAWEVVEKYTDAVIEKVGDHYCVNLIVESVCAETAPLAICRAALLAVMK